MSQQSFSELEVDAAMAFGLAAGGAMQAFRDGRDTLGGAIGRFVFVFAVVMGGFWFLRWSRRFATRYRITIEKVERP